MSFVAPGCAAEFWLISIPTPGRAVLLNWHVESRIQDAMHKLEAQSAAEPDEAEQRPEPEAPVN
ncbi:MAG: hypothetical protein CXZ00_14295 [Acidobacteria bacterium]|nr:MAG: hypothetical protein CXZ00_14295 [Acidobacteriota bacterium]